MTINKIFDKSNLWLLAVGVLTLIAGYLCLSRGPLDNPLSLSVAPVLLIAAYCVIIPIAIIKKNKKGD